MELPKHYSLREDNKDHFVIHDKRDDKSFKVSKKGLHPATQMKVMKIQKFDEGGSVLPDDYQARLTQALTPQAEPVETSPQAEQQNEYAKNLQGVLAKPQMAQNIDPSQLAIPQTPVQPSGPAPVQPPSPIQEMEAANKLGVASANVQAQGEIEKSKAQADMYAQQQLDLKALQQTHQAKLEELGQRSDELFNAATQGKIDPEQYWQNHSKITAGLGVLLAGIGQGLSHSTTNMALDAINNNINKNIDAQKANMNQTNNLYRMNLERTHNEQEAYLATKADNYALVAAKANQIAAQAGTPEAQAKNLQLQYYYKNQIAQTHMQVAGMGIAHQAYTDGIPMQSVPYLPKEQQEIMVPLPNGQMALASGKDSAAEVKTTMAPYLDAKSSLDRLEKISAIYAKLPAGPQRAQAETEVHNIVGTLMQMSKQNRFADPAVNYQLEKISDPTNLKDIFNGTAGTDQLRKVLDGKMDSVYRANVPAYSTMKGRESQNRAKINFKESR